MKKNILLAVLAMVAIGAMARKSYVNLYVKSLENIVVYSGATYIYEGCYLTGDVPSDMNNFYNDTDYTGGDLLNMLSERGYEVESVVAYADGSGKVCYLLSKESSSGQMAGTGDVNLDGKVNVSDIAVLVNKILGLVLKK